MNYSYRKLAKRAFTLAEVLITLAIIGIVAALTIPTLIANYQKQETLTRFKKFYSMFNSALKLAQAENGDMSTWAKPKDISISAWGKLYIEPYIKVNKICKSYEDCGYKENDPWTSVDGTPDATNVVDIQTPNTSRVTYILNDGAVLIIQLYKHTGDPDQPYEDGKAVIVDFNGANGPNVMGKDTFIFNRDSNGIADYCKDQSDSLINSQCSQKAGRCCSTKIIKDNWQIKDDYPW